MFTWVLVKVVFFVLCMGLAMAAVHACMYMSVFQEYIPSFTIDCTSECRIYPLCCDGVTCCALKSTQFASIFYCNGLRRRNLSPDFLQIQLPLIKLFLVCCKFHLVIQGTIHAEIILHGGISTLSQGEVITKHEAKAGVTSL